MKKKNEDSESATQQYTFRIPVDLKAQMESIAKEDDRSLARQIIVALRLHVQQRKAKPTE